jgi:hypothetical protein
VTPLTDFLQKTERGEKLSVWFNNLSFWRRKKAVSSDGLVEKDKTGGVGRGEQ